MIDKFSPPTQLGPVKRFTYLYPIDATSVAQIVVEDTKEVVGFFLPVGRESYPVFTTEKDITIYKDLRGPYSMEEDFFVMDEFGDPQILDSFTTKFEFDFLDNFKSYDLMGEG